MDSWATEKKVKGQKRLGIPTLTPDDILKEGKSRPKEESPIDLSFHIMKEVRLPPLVWENFNVPPKLMKISNSGATAIVSAKWYGPRPYLASGPVSGHYVFSQLHFHWGRSFEEGSEHKLNGESLPLEAHAMFFKNIYISQDDAMKKLDGIITVAYFFNLQEEDNESLNPITDALSTIATPMTSEHIDPVPLKQFMPSFSNDYFVYWGKVANMSVLWCICRKPLGIGTKQLSSFQKLIGDDQKPIEKNFREIKDLNHRVVFHVNPSENKTNLLLPKEDDKRRETKKMNTNVYNAPGVQKNVINQALYTVAVEEGRTEEYAQNTKEDNTEFVSERSNNCLIGDSADKKDSMTDLINLSLKGKPNVKELKYTLARILLELEKKENDDDFGVLENYIKAKYSAEHEKLMMERNLHKSDNDAEDDAVRKAEPLEELDEDKTLTHVEINPEEIEGINFQSERSNKELHQDDQNEDQVYGGKHPLQEENTTANIYNKRKCQSASESERFSRAVPNCGENSRLDNPEVVTSHRAELKVEKKHSSHCIRKKSGEMLAIRTSCEVEETLTILTTTKADSVHQSEMTNSDLDEAKTYPVADSSSEEDPRKNRYSRKRNGLQDFDIKAIKERLRKQRLARALPEATGGGGTATPKMSPTGTQQLQRKERNNPTTLQAARDESESERRRAMIRKSMMGLMKDRPQTGNKNKPKTPERPAWKP